MKEKKSYKVALLGMLLALCLVLSGLESAVVPIFGLAPGIKLGLANLVVMYALLFLSVKQGLLLVILKALFAMVTRGVVAGLVSFSGGMLSLTIMWILLRFTKTTHLILSASGAISHNIGQLFAASLLLGSGLAMGYAPVLLISGLVVGSVNSMLLDAVMPYLKKF